jgi:hypothetical protein
MCAVTHIIRFSLAALAALASTRCPRQQLLADPVKCRQLGSRSGHTRQDAKVGFKILKAGRKEAPLAMAGLGNNPVQGFRTGRAAYLEFLRLRTGFELPSSWRALPCYGASLNRNSFCVMRWPQIGLGAQDLNDIQRPKSFQKIAESKVLDE